MNSTDKLKFSDKYKDFLCYNDASFECLEGTTASGKTTTGIIKFMLRVAASDRKQHIISGRDLGVVEKNIITAELGILDIFGQYVTYYPHGGNGDNLPHIEMQRPDGVRIIYILGYDNKARWQKALGGQYGCVYVDEINIADMDYITQVAMRCDYFMCTLNPDDPEREIYKRFINRCRPLPQYVDSTPEEMLEYLSEPAMDGWVWWYFTFDDNAGLTEEKKQKIKSTHTPGSADYKHYILGLRGKAEGVIFDNFDVRKHVVTTQYVKSIVEGKADEKFIQFSSGLDTSYSKNSDDTVAMSFLGITNKGNCYILDENVLNNRDTKVPFAPSDIAAGYEAFLNTNKDRYGFSRYEFIDNADSATITECGKYKRANGSIYTYMPCSKKVKIIDRIQLQKGWIATGHFYVSETCTTLIHELQVYSWGDGTKVEPEDGHDHMINSVQYAWIPYKEKIGDK